MIGILHCTNGSGMSAAGDEDRVVPSLRSGILKKVFANPEHEAMPVVGRSSIHPALLGIRFQKTRTARIKLVCDLARKGTAGFDSRSSPIGKCFPIDETRNGVRQAFRVNQLEARSLLANRRQEPRCFIASSSLTTPLLERGILDGSGLLPFLYRFRPAS